MFTNGKIVVCKYIIWFDSNLYFCQTHICISLLFIYLSGVTHMENDLLFCSKLMFTNGKIKVYEFMIQFYSYLYFCQSYSWNKDYLINYSQ